MKRTLVSVLFVGLIFWAISCGQWRVSSLKSKAVCSLNKGSQPGNIMIDYNDSSVLNLSFVIRIFNGKIYTGDNILKRVQVLDMDGTPLVVIGPKGAGETANKKIKQSNFNFSVIGSMAVDSKGVLYVQNRLMPSGAAAKSEREDESDFSPSYILVFDKNGSLQHTLGQRGTPDLPFYYIEDLFADSKDRLFVVSRSFETWSVSRFSGRKRDFYIDLGAVGFKETEGNDTYTGKIENVKIYETGEDLLISVAYYFGARFKYRKIYEYSVKNNSITKTILNIPDPKNELFTLVDDKHIYLWNVENKKVKFVIFNFDGNVINNVMIEMQGNKYFEDVLTDETGQLFSYHLGKKDIEILEWK